MQKINNCSLGIWKSNSSFNLTSHQPDIDKLYLYAKHPYEAKYQQKRENTGLKDLSISKAFIEYSNDMDGVYENIEEYNPDNKCKIFMAFDGIIVDMLSNKELNPIVTELLIRGRKLNISLLFITQSYFTVPKNIRLNSTHYFIMKIPNKQELQLIAFIHSSDSDIKKFANLYKYILQNHIVF